MADDDTRVHVAAVLTDAAGVPEPDVPAPATRTNATFIINQAASDAPPQTHNAQDNTNSGASMPPAIAKRAMDDGDAAGDESEQLQRDLPPRKKARTGSAAGSLPAESITESAEKDGGELEGDGITSSSSDGKHSTSSPDGSSQHAAAGPAVGALRTSFAQPGAAPPRGLPTSIGEASHAASQAQNPKTDVTFKMHNPLTADERQQLVATIQDLGSLAVCSVFKRKLKWTVSPLKVEYFTGTTWLEIIEAAIDKWCESFVIDNQANVDQVGLAPSLLKVGFERRLEVCDGEQVPKIFKEVTNLLLKNPDGSRLRKFGTAFKPDLAKLAKRQARKDEQVASKWEESSPTSRESKNTQNGVKMEDGEINSADASGADMEIDEDVASISQSELHQRHRYFPGIPDDTIFCLTCAHLGHSTERCPEVSCKFCKGPHFKYQCPTRQRCARCKQLGHTKTTCPEKLAVAPGESAIECAICEGCDHTEINCIQLYQIYRPAPGKVKKVKQIPAHCYVCATEGHFGGDCPMADPRLPPTRMWTMATASLYIDPESDDVALCFRNPLPPPPEVLRPNIPGRSIKPQTHVVYEESDGDGDGDLVARASGGPLKKRGAKKNNLKPNTAPTINIASNISFGGAGARNSVRPSNPTQQPQQQPQQQGPPKKQKGPAQPQNKSNKPGNDALLGTKPSRRHSHPPKFTGVRSSQPPPLPKQGGGGGRGGGGKAGRGGGGGFSALNADAPARSGRRTRRGRGGGGQN